MTSRSQVLESAAWYQKRYECGPPIFEIMLFEFPDKELLSDSGEPIGWPDEGSKDFVGFYYEIDTAIRAMNENWCDIQEGCFYAGFVLCKFPGLYQCAGREARMYFLWDEERKGFFEAEEPERFRHVAY